MRAAVAGFLMLACGTARADIWESLAGRWTGSGEVSGMAAKVELEFRDALGRRGRHLSFSNDMRGADGKVWPFRAEAFYLCEKSGACSGHWYDTRGMTLPLKTSSQKDRLMVEWGDESTERGRTTYRIDPDGKLRITDEVRGKDGVWKVFGKTVATRAGAPP
ncbi:MAG TPA: hypothetical protein VJ806_02210 [Luteimonas sp.]|nr:hypothetical protein [Luteimonas sp.]